MAIEFQEKTVLLKGCVGVEEAELLLEWLQKTPCGQVDLTACTHLHAANLQVLMAARPTVLAWPKEAALLAWLTSSLQST
ncbi:hypothetical protein [Paludibacterium yongneupense]|uniref:hypothetical protein n=1 Tax=Paludibacterium yongneupense TaxID=400061 RepID=UPI000419C03E|nr:hypothetical protein [Paludibacterium yongneupense]